MSSRRERRKRKKDAQKRESQRQRELEQRSMLPDTAYEGVEDFDAYVYGDSNGYGEHDVGNPAPVSTPVASKPKKSKHGSWWKRDVTDASWDLKREKRDRENASADAADDVEFALKRFRFEFGRFTEDLPMEFFEPLQRMMATHADLSIAQARKDLIDRETDRLSPEGGIEPRDTKFDFLDLGARFYRVLEMDPLASQSNLDLLAATLDAVSYITPASWHTIEREIAEDAKRELG